MSPVAHFKRPESILVVIHTPSREVLLLERLVPPGFWQSVTGSLEDGETPIQAAAREVAEETGIAIVADELCDWQQTNEFEIRPEWRSRYGPEVTRNVEHVFSLCLPAAIPVRIALQEHTAYEWLSVAEAARKVFSWTNREAILKL